MSSYYSKLRSHRRPSQGSMDHCVFTASSGKKIDKIRYKDKRMAVDALHKLQNIGKFETEKYGATNRHEDHAYKCDRCKGWHTTSKKDYTLGA